MFQADLKYDKHEPCSNHGGIFIQSDAEHDRLHAQPEPVIKDRPQPGEAWQNVKLEGTAVKEDRKIWSCISRWQCKDAG